MKTKHNEASLSISTHEPASNSQPTIFAPNNEGGTEWMAECLRKSSTNEHSPQDCSWDNILTWSTLTFGKPRKRKKEQLFRCAKNRNTQIKNPSTLALPNPTRTWMTYSKNGDHLTCCCNGAFWCNGTGLHAIEKMPRSRTWLKTECEDPATTTHVAHHCAVSKRVRTCYFTKRVMFHTIVNGKTWGTSHTILLRDVGRRNNVRLAPTRNKRFRTAEKRNSKLPAHNVCIRKKSVQTCVGFSDKCLNRRHTRWMRMTPTPCPTRHLSHHWIMAGANKHAERTTNFSREMMNLALLKTSETTSVNIDVTRHPSVKKPLPMRKQVSDENAIHDTHLTNPNVNNLDRTAHGSG